MVASSMQARRGQYLFVGLISQPGGSCTHFYTSSITKEMDYANWPALGQACLVLDVEMGPGPLPYVG